MPAVIAPLVNPRKQPRQRRSEATVEAIVEAAAQVVAERGLAGFNTNSVARRAGVSIGSLYQYFPGKDSIMAALIARQHRDQVQNLLAALAQQPTESLEERVRTLVRAAMRHHYDNALLASAIDHEEERLPVGNVSERIMEAAGPRLLELLDGLRDELPLLDPHTALRTLPPLLRAVVDAWANLVPPDLIRAEEEGVRAVLGYLRQGNHSAASVD